MPNICNIQCTNIVSNICNTSPPLKEKFWKPRGYKILQEIFTRYIHTGNNFYKTYLSKYKSKIDTMYNFYKLTNYRYINHTLNTASGQGVSMRTPYVTFSKSCLYTEFLSLTVFLLIAIISYVIPLSKYGFTIVISTFGLNVCYHSF